MAHIDDIIRTLDELLQPTIFQDLGPNGLPAGSLGGISGSHWFGVEPLTGIDLWDLKKQDVTTTQP